MEIDDLLKLMSSQGTVRHFKPDPVSEEDLEKILQATRWAPSGANTQPWDFVVVKNPELKEEIAQIFVESHQRAKKEDKEFPYETGEGLRRRFTDPPILIVVCADTRFMKAYPKVGYREEILNVSMGAATQNMMLAANALGLGLSWGTVDTLNRDKLQKLLGVPTHIRILEVLQLGYPAERVLPRFRRDPHDFTHVDKFDASKLRSEKEIKNLLSTRTSPDIYSGVRKLRTK
ncbi:MAG: nitroreductase family protein [Actinomycetota bacterium]|nr:nitroreductase family protein [Actinomycetota bacterium]